jgi:hypothetical protein
MINMLGRMRLPRRDMGVQKIISGQETKKVN